MQEIKNAIFTTKYTRVLCEDPDKIVFNAPHNFVVMDSVNEDNVLAEVNFQKGPIKENDVNGVHNEDLLLMVLTRLHGFQNSEYACRENALAITKIEEAAFWLRKRTMDREMRNVEGTSKV
jgi:hypothetical protein